MTPEVWAIGSPVRTKMATMTKATNGSPGELMGEPVNPDAWLLEPLNAGPRSRDAPGFLTVPQL